MFDKRCRFRLLLRTGSNETPRRDGMPVLEEERCRGFRLLLARTGGASDETPGRGGMPVPVPVEGSASTSSAGTASAAVIGNVDLSVP